MGAADFAQPRAAAGSVAVEARVEHPPLRIEELVISYGAKEVVHGVSFDTPRNEIFTLIGPSGCGKTTILRSLNQLADLVGAKRPGQDPPRRRGHALGRATT